MKGVAAILVALCLIYLQDADATVKTLRKSLIAADKRLAFWIDSYTDEHLTYALCDSKHLQADDVKCTVIREKKPYADDTYSCEVTLKRPHVRHDPERLPRISVYPFGQKYAALTVWEQDTYLNFTIVEMDSCKVSEAGMHIGSSLGWLSVPFVGHSDSFDVFFNKDALCGDKMCKATIGIDGRIINEPRPSIKKYVRSDYVMRPIVALDNDSSGNGYYYLTKDGNDYIHMLVKPDGTEKSLERHPKPTGMVTVSTKNNLLGVCYQMNDKLECNQYDFDGNLKLHTTITDDDKNHGYMNIYNLPTGGFYVFSLECLVGPRGNCIDFKRYLIERIDPNGTKSGPIVFQGFDNSFPWKVLPSLFYENDAKEVCFSLAATRGTIDKDGGRSELTANCFTDADFSK